MPAADSGIIVSLEAGVFIFLVFAVFVVESISNLEPIEVSSSLITAGVVGVVLLKRPPAMTLYRTPPTTAEASTDAPTFHDL